MDGAGHSSLRYIADSAPGIHRLRRGKRNGKPVFQYLNSRGKPLRDAATLARIRSLAIPPAYEQVWICPDARGHLQATGLDARGRKQYRYHPQWRQAKDEAKHARMQAFGSALPRLRRLLRADLKRPGLPRDKVVALVISVMDRTCVRVGNEEYARSNGSFGLSTLENRHARVAGGHVVLRFRGKGGAPHEVVVDDTLLASLIRECRALPGRRLFQYQDSDGRRHAITSAHVNEYLHRHLGGDFSAKDFRTWHATRQACQLLLKLPRPEPCSDRACRKALAAVIAEVSQQLRNTPTVCRKSYVNPLVLEAWREGTGPFARQGARSGSAVRALLALLRHRPRAAGAGKG